MDILTYGLLNKKVEEAKNVSGEKITEAVNTYLNENPPTTGATAEQAAQIDKNVADIYELKGDLVEVEKAIACKESYTIPYDVEYEGTKGSLDVNDGSIIDGYRVISKPIQLSENAISINVSLPNNSCIVYEYDSNDAFIKRFDWHLNEDFTQVVQKDCKYRLLCDGDTPKNNELSPSIETISSLLKLTVNYKSVTIENKNRIDVIEKKISNYLTGGRTSTGIFIKEYDFVAGHTYRFTNTSSEGAMNVGTRLSKSDSDDYEVIATGLNYGCTTHFTALKNANFIRIYGNSAFTFELYDETTIDGQINNISYKVDVSEKVNEFTNKFNTSTETDSFLFFTDPHLLDGTDELTINDYVTSIKNYINNAPINALLCGGDWIGTLDTPSQAKAKLSRINKLFDLPIPFYNVVGNHDTNYQGYDENGIKYSEGGSPTFDAQLINNILFKKYGTNKNYYYFKLSNTTFYALDTWLDWTASEMIPYLWEQIDWLANELINKDNKHNAILMHIWYYTDTTKSAMAQNIGLLCKAYNEKTTIALNNITYDFTNTQGKLEFVLSGHTHQDYVNTDYDFPVVITTWTRDGGKPTFDLCYVDYDNNELNLVRVGTGTSRIINLIN